MTLKDIMAISGYPGLFKNIAQGRNGIIVEGLENGKRMNAYATMKVSSLGDIAIFTEGSDVPLKEVLKKIREKESGNAISELPTETKKLFAYFSEILPDFDKERVYASDIKKLLGWYNILQKKELLGLLDLEEEQSKEDPAKPE